MGDGRTGHNLVPEMDLADYVNLIICSAFVLHICSRGKQHHNGDARGDEV